MRVGIISLLHESNTFVRQQTTLEHFEQDTLLIGDAIRQRFEGSPHEIGGFFRGLEAEGIDAVPIFAARAVPFGPIQTESFDRLISMMQNELAKAGRLDGLLVAPHGATVCASIRDADGYWLNRVRKYLGQGTPIIGTLDAHANLSRQMIDSTDGLIAYRTNPHLDQLERGMEAVQLLVRTLRGECLPIQHALFPPIAINIECQMTSEPPLSDLYELADRGLSLPGVLANSIFLGFPYADVEEMGSSISVIADADSDDGKRLAEQLAEYLIQNRHRFNPSLVGIDEALSLAANMEGPVCLLDMGDNVGGGSPGDSTLLTHAIRKHGKLKSFVCIQDRESASQAQIAGVGATLTLEVGGKSDNLHGKPIEGQFRVLSISDGKFTDHKIRHGGFGKYDQGKSAVVQSTDTCRLTILLTSNRTPPFSLEQLISCGIDPADYQLLIAKGVNAPLAAYGEVCANFIRVNTPGCTTAEMSRLDYQNRRRPIYPFEQI